MTLTREAFATVEDRVEESTHIWARDLQSLFEHAKDRFGDVSWETDHGGERIWGHKAVIYARAPKAFKDRYFISRPFSRSPTSVRSPSPSPSHLAPPNTDSRPTSPPTSFRHDARFLAAPSSLSVHSISSEYTVRAPSDGVLRLTHGDTPELFQAQLEWLYTGEGFGDVVEWISEDDAANEVSLRDSLGRRGSRADRRDRLGQDLTYMWRSKLYVDVRIHLAPLMLDIPDSSDSDESTDSLSSTAVFTAHRFVLVSRSPYFSSLLLNHSSFRPTGPGSSGTADIHLPTPPFTPASLHYCLGWMYAGHLDFSNRSFDLTTAFDIYRAAAYLQLDSLMAEVASRIVWDFCHGLDYSRCRCRKCASRVARVWRFATSADVGAVDMGNRARRYLQRGWGDCWGRDVGTLEAESREELLQDVLGGIGWRNVIPTFRAVGTVRARTEHALRTKGREAAEWVERLGEMLHRVEARARVVLAEEFGRVADGTELWDLLSGTGFSDDLLETVLAQLVAGVGAVGGANDAPKVYQTLVSSILLKVDPDTLQTVLPARSTGRQRIEAAKEGVLAHIRRRYMQIKDEGGFVGLENWSLKEIADEIEVGIDELLSVSVSPAPARHTPKATRPSMSATRSQCASLGNMSTSSLGSSRLTLGAARSRPSLPKDMRDPPEVNGLRRLRLSSSASTSSAKSTRSQLPSPRPTTPTEAGPSGSGDAPQPRSPTAARNSKRVSIGPGRRAEGGDRPGSGGAMTLATAASPAPASPTLASASKRGSQIMSGPIRQLHAKGSIGAAGGTALAGSEDKGKGRAVDQGAAPGGESSGGSHRSAGTTIGVSEKGKGKAVDRGPVVRPSPSLSSLRSARSAKSVKGMAPVEAPSKVRGAALPILPAARGPRVSAGASEQSTSRIPRKSGVAAAPVVPAVKAMSESPAARIRHGSAATAASVAPATRSRMTSSASVASKASTLVSSPPAPPAPARTTIKKPLGPPAGRAPSISSVRSTVPAKTVAASMLRSDARARTVSQATTASVRSTAPSVASTLRSAARPASSPDQGVGPARQSRVSASGARPSGLGPAPASRAPATATAQEPGKPKSGAVRSSRPAPPTAMPSLHPPASRSASSSTEGPELRTPRTSDPGDAAIRRISDMSDDFGGPYSGRLPPISAPPRYERKVSSGSTRSTASAWRQHPATAFDPPKRVELAPLEQSPVPQGLKAYRGPGVSLNVGIPCIVNLDGRRGRFRAQVKYLGFMAGTTGPWVGIELEHSTRLGKSAYERGAKDGVHYFHFTLPDSHTAASEGERDAEYERRVARHRKIEAIREGLSHLGSRGKKGSLGPEGLAGGYGFGLGLGLGMGMGMGRGVGSQGRSASGPGSKRSTSPFVGPGQAGGVGEWVPSGAEMRAMFVRPSEVVYVVGAE